MSCAGCAGCSTCPIDYKAAYENVKMDLEQAQKEIEEAYNRGYRDGLYDAREEEEEMT